jgi:hypothetical protein
MLRMSHAAACSFRGRFFEAAFGELEVHVNSCGLVDGYAGGGFGKVYVELPKRLVAQQKNMT